MVTKTSHDGIDLVAGAAACHCQSPDFNPAAPSDILKCQRCGSSNLRKNGTSPTGQKWRCNKCNKRFVVLE